MEIAHSYDRLAPAYDRRWQRYLTETLTPVTKILSDPTPLRLLDVACGTGELIRRLLALSPQSTVVGMDGSEAMLEVARKKFQDEGRVTLQRALADALPFPDRSFDWVVCCNSLHCFQKPDKVFSEMARVLKPGGRVLVLDWCRNPWHCRLINQWLRLFDKTHVWMYTTKELSRLAEKHQIVIESLKRFRISWPLGLRFWEMMFLVGSLQ